MPCNSDYLDATKLEREMSRVACLLDELNGKTWQESHWNGYHPSVYNQDFDADKMVKQLCGKLQTVDVSKQSLEMQIWWRDHQAADKRRVEAEMKRAKNDADRAAALSKLTPYERRLLGA